MSDLIRVGVIGASLKRGWGSATHIPALLALDEYEVTAVCTTSMGSAQASAEHFGVSHAFDDPGALAAHEDVDLVAVCVKVPYHYELVKTALAAGKHVYCEWPLTTSAAEAAQLLALAEERGVHHAVGLQARADPVFQRAHELIREGFAGEVLSVSLTATGWYGGRQSDSERTYMLDEKNRVGFFEIVGGHTLDAFSFCLGPFDVLAAVVETKHPSVRIVGSDEELPKTAPDLIQVIGRLEGGGMASIHIAGGKLNGARFVLDITGSGGDLQITSLGGSTVQLEALTLSGATGLHHARYDEEKRHTPGPSPALVEIETSGDVELPEAVRAQPFRNVARMYRQLARDINEDTDTAPNFRTALDCHELLETIREHGGRPLVDNAPSAA